MSAAIPLATLGKLNASARNPCSAAWYRPELSGAIYAYKLLAAMTLFAAGLLKVRFVKDTYPCLCGDGKYRDQYGETWRCRYCAGTAKVELSFTETALPDGQVWHHPWQGRSLPGMLFTDGKALDELTWETPSPDWRPNMPGLALTLDELVPMLNHVEDWVESVELPECGAPYWWIARHAKACLHLRTFVRVHGPPSHAYKLDLGRHGKCLLCGGSENLGNEHGGESYGILTPLFHWSQPTCGACGKLKKHPQNERPKQEPPDDLLTPALRYWIERHSKVVTEV